MGRKNLYYAVYSALLVIVGSSFTRGGVENSQDYVLQLTNVKYFTQASSKLLSVHVRFTNNTNDTLKYLSMTCAPLASLYRLDSKLLQWADTLECVGSYPEILYLPPHTSRKDSILFKFKKDYKLPIKYRIGFFLAKPEGKNLWYYTIQKNVQYRMVWSSSSIIKTI